MKKIYKIKKKSSLKENLAKVIPEMFDDFFAFAPVVMNFPLRKVQLHEMRKAGKPLRYAMELGEYCFNNDFKLCLDDIKNSLDLMGEIHDADVMIPVINLYMKQIRIFNNTLPVPDMRFSTKQLRDYINFLRKQRSELHAELCVKINMWDKNSFRQKIADSMK